MKPNFGHTATTSFTMWFENHLLKAGEAYDNKTGILYHVDDTRLPNSFFRYSSPYKQWVTESGVGGSYVPTGIYDANGIIDKTKPEKGYYFDFENGGIVVTGNAASNDMMLSGSFAVKEFNIYNTNQTEEALVIENKFDNNSRFAIPESGIVPYDMVTPSIFINNEYIENTPYAFGGEDKTSLIFKSVVLAENLYQLDGVLSLFSDTRNSTVADLNFEDYPINEYGDLKTGKYSYLETCRKSSKNPFNIEKVSTSKISDNVRTKISPSLYVGFIDFEISKPRFPRI
ncbi:MAG: hypothetical protein P8P37_02380 [Candidatus Marinimicrobia bacterium]|nr:hypothetical protein [Candidatus Neomarinimicrobiota bacterium]